MVAPTNYSARQLAGIYDGLKSEKSTAENHHQEINDFVNMALLDMLSDYTAADHCVFSVDGWYGVDRKIIFIGQRMQGLDTAATVSAEAEIIAYDNDLCFQGMNDDSGNKISSR